MPRNIEPQPPHTYPDASAPQELDAADAGKRRVRRESFHRELRKRIAKRVPSKKLPAFTPRHRPPEGMAPHGSGLPPTHFPGAPSRAPASHPETPSSTPPQTTPVETGDKLAARARRIRKKRDAERNPRD